MDMISKIKKILQNLILDIEDYDLSASQRQEVKNAITEIRCEIINFEQDLETL